MLEEIDRYAAVGESFAFEARLAGKGYAPRIDTWQKSGYRVKLIFHRLFSVTDAIERVRLRVSQGGHGIPESVIRRRFEAGLVNFDQLYKQRVDRWQLIDNGGSQPLLMAEWENQ